MRVGDKVRIVVPEEWRGKAARADTDAWYAHDNYAPSIGCVSVNREMTSMHGHEATILNIDSTASLSGFPWSWPLAMLEVVEAAPTAPPEGWVLVEPSQSFYGMGWDKTWRGEWRFREFEKNHHETGVVWAPPGAPVDLPDGWPAKAAVVRVGGSWHVVEEIKPNGTIISQMCSNAGSVTNITGSYPPGTNLCKHCRVPIAEDEEREEDCPHNVCASCYEDYVYCDRCGDWVHSDDTYTGNGETYCEDCWDRVSETCDHCGDRFHMDDLADGMCASCREDYSRCTDCGDIYNNEDLDDEGRCESCRPDTVNRYDYRPRFVKHGSPGPYFGVELEVDRDEGRPDNADHAQACIDRAPDGFLYAKHDGSLDAGFELVSMPGSLDYHMRTANWGAVCKQALRLGYRSHDVETCGLHVHIGRDAFDSDASIAKLLLLFDMHWEKILRFSRRTRDKADRWAARYSMKRTEDRQEAVEEVCKATENTSRYCAVNLQNDNTVEIRIMRGSLNTTTVLATIQWCAAMVRIVNENSLSDIVKMKWSDMCRVFNEYDHLKAYLKLRFADAQMVEDEGTVDDELPDLPDGDEVEPIAPLAFDGEWVTGAAITDAHVGQPARILLSAEECERRFGGCASLWRRLIDAPDLRMTCGPRNVSGRVRVSADECVEFSLEPSALRVRVHAPAPAPAPAPALDEWVTGDAITQEHVGLPVEILVSAEECESMCNGRAMDWQRLIDAPDLRLLSFEHDWHAIRSESASLAYYLHPDLMRVRTGRWVPATDENCRAGVMARLSMPGDARRRLVGDRALKIVTNDHALSFPVMLNEVGWCEFHHLEVLVPQERIG